MLTRRSFVKLLAGAAAGLFAGKARATEAVQPETPFSGEITNVVVHDHALSPAEVMKLWNPNSVLPSECKVVLRRPLELNPDNPLTEGLIACWSGAELVLRTTESTIYWDESPSDGPDEPLHWCLPPLRKCWPMNDGRGE